MRKGIIPYLKGGALTAAVVLFLPLVTPRLNGQIAVFDATSWASLGKIWNEDISNGAKMIQEYNELVKIWTSGMQIYNLGMSMARSQCSTDRPGRRWARFGRKTSRMAPS